MAQTNQATQEKTEEKQQDAAQTDSKVEAQNAEFSEASGGEVSGPAGSIGILLDMDVPVTVAIGQTEVPVRRLLQLGPGSVLKLDKPIDAPADLYMRETRFATGNIVIVEGRFAVRIKSILGLEGAVENIAGE